MLKTLLFIILLTKAASGADKPQDCEKAFKNFLKAIQKPIDPVSYTARINNESKLEGKLVQSYLANHFHSLTKRSISNLLKELKVDGGNYYSLSQISFNSDLNLVLIKVPPPNPQSQKIFNKVIVARIFPNGNLEPVGELKEQSKKHEIINREAQFIEDSHTARLHTVHRSSEHPTYEDFVFYDLTLNTPKKLTTLSDVSGMRFKQVYAFEKNIYVGQLFNNEFAFMRYNTQTKSYALIYKGFIDPRVADYFTYLSEYLSITISGPKVIFKESVIDFEIDPFATPAFKLINYKTPQNDQPIVVNNKAMSARIEQLKLHQDPLTSEFLTTSDYKETTHAAFVLYDETAKQIEKKWVIEGTFNLSPIHQLGDGFLVERQSASGKAYLVHLKNDGSVIDITSASERLAYWAVINNTVVGFTLPDNPKKEINFITIPLK